MRTIRVIPCLDIKDGRVVKGTQFLDLKDSGDPVELGRKYSEEGADELVFLDISASTEGRPAVVTLAEKVAKEIFIPFTVGGGMNSPESVREALMAGADKVSLNTAAIKQPGLISFCAERFGSQCIVIAIDARKRSDGGWDVFTHGGRQATGIDAIRWAQEATQRGAGEILLTSMDGDGMRTGYDLELTRAISQSVDIPVVASGGAGRPSHLCDAVRYGLADAVLVAGILHEGHYTIGELKAAMAADGLPIRPVPSVIAAGTTES